MTLPPRDQPPARPDRSRAWMIGLALIVALAAFLRFYALDRVPPGLESDEAYNALEARRIVQTGRLPIFFADNFGEEPFHMYLIALQYRLFGITPLGGRPSSAFAGTLTVLLLFALVREMFRTSLSMADARLTALAACLVLAILGWHIRFSRSGMETIMLSPFSVAAFAALWRAWNTRRVLWHVIAGALLGLSLYTYKAANLLPFVVMIYFAIWALKCHAVIRERWRAMLTYFAVALLAFLPLGLYFLQNPQWFLVRAQTTTAPVLGSQADTIANLITNAGKTILGLFWSGDTDLKLNLPGQPVLDPFLFLLLLSAIVWGLRPSSRTRGPVVFSLIWLSVMLVPSVLTDSAPQFGRMSGAMPAVAVLCGYGVIAWVQALRAIRTKSLARSPRAGQVLISGGVTILVAGLIWSGLNAYQDYFVRWANYPGLAERYHAPIVKIAEYFNAQPADALMFVTPVSHRHYTLQFLTDESPRLDSYNGESCAVLPEAIQHDTSFAILQPQVDRSLDMLKRAYPDGQVVPLMPPELIAYAVPTAARFAYQPAHPVSATYDDKIELRGYDLPTSTFKPGATVDLTLAWRATRSIDQSYRVFLQLWGRPGPLEGGRSWAKVDRSPCGDQRRTTQWTTDQVVADRYQLYLPPDIPPGTYDLVAGLYNPSDKTRLPITQTDQTERIGKSYLPIGSIQVTP